MLVKKLISAIALLGLSHGACYALDGKTSTTAEGGSVPKESPEKKIPERTLKEFGLLDLEIIYREKKNKLDALNGVKPPNSVVAPNQGAAAQLSSPIPVQAPTVQTPEQIKAARAAERKLIEQQKKEAAIRAALPPRPNNLTLKNIYGVGSNPTAVLVNGNGGLATVKLNSTVAGWEVVGINESGVTLKQGQFIHVLNVSHEILGKPAPEVAGQGASAQQNVNSVQGQALPSPRL